MYRVHLPYRLVGDADLRTRLLESRTACICNIEVVVQNRPTSEARIGGLRVLLSSSQVWFWRITRQGYLLTFEMVLTGYFQRFRRKNSGSVHVLYPVHVRQLVPLVLSISQPTLKSASINPIFYPWQDHPSLTRRSSQCQAVQIGNPP